MLKLTKSRKHLIVEFFGEKRFHMRELWRNRQKKEGSAASDVGRSRALPRPECPECGSQKTWKDGVRYSGRGRIQRFLCRSCGHRFSDPEVKVDVIKQRLVFSDSVHDFGEVDSVKLGVGEVGFKDSTFAFGEDVGSHGFSVVGKTINKFLPNSREHRVCASEDGAKNLAETKTRTKNRLAGATPDVKGKIVEYSFWLLKQGYAKSTIKGRTKLLKRLTKLGANLYDPESIKEVIAEQEWSAGRKANAVDAYTSFLQMRGTKWEPPIYKKIRKLPFIPTETEIDQIIAGCNRRMATFLQLLKETGVRCGEACQLKWTDVDLVTNSVRITPEKRSNARILQVSNKMVDMLNGLPKNSKRVFGANTDAMRKSFQMQRRRIAAKLRNTRILQITFHTFRHWKATMEYHKTRDILHVMQILGHRSIQNTLIYTQLLNVKDDEYVARVASTEKEACQLVEAGFEYVCEYNGNKIFRKRK
jgi:integrase